MSEESGDDEPGNGTRHDGTNDEPGNGTRHDGTDDEPGGAPGDAELAGSDTESTERGDSEADRENADREDAGRENADREDASGREETGGEETGGEETGGEDTGGEDTGGEDTGRPSWAPERLHRLRRDPPQRRVAFVVAGVVGLGLVWLHWLGLFVAGALVGLVSRDLPRALIAGLGFGLLVLVVHVLAAPEMGFGAFLGLTPISYVTIAAALVAPAWGALVRGIV